MQTAWAIIRILEGGLRYCKEDGLEAEILDPSSPGLVRPDEPHHCRSACKRNPLGGVIGVQKVSLISMV